MRPQRRADGRHEDTPTCDGATEAVGLSPSAVLVPDVAHETLPAVLRLRELVVRLARYLVARVTLLHERVQLPHRETAGSFQLVRIGFVRHFSASGEGHMLNYSL